ncbi:hypothetical protein ABZT51_52360 [Streptomyces sp. NPDC005373]|uniref:hypothetical protein n=1 Tax=Streptomyces sp. NPDC005373 TaxID=3156879 RepID=UPI0033B6AF63
MDNSIGSAPASVRETISGIGTAVRDGDDARIKALLDRLLNVADPAALFLLHNRLNEDVGGPGARLPLRPGGTARSTAFSSAASTRPRASLRRSVAGDPATARRAGCPVRQQRLELRPLRIS